MNFLRRFQRQRSIMMARLVSGERKIFAHYSRLIHNTKSPLFRRRGDITIL